MHSLRSKITFLTVCAVVIAMVVGTVFGIIAIRNMGYDSSKQSLMLLCEVGEKNLDSYFEKVERSVEMVSAYVESDLDGIDDERLQAHLDRVSDIFKKMTYDTNGILTYYYRIDPTISENVKGFWYVNLDGEGFQEHEVTDISLYDTNDTSKLVWFTVPKATGDSVWLPPYITDNLDKRVLSYNVPVYYEGTFVGVIGIEMDYSTMAEQVDNITLYEDGYAFINDAEGTIVYHPHIDVEELAENHPKVPEGLLSDNAFITYTHDGVEKQAVWLTLSNGMRLNVTVPVAEIDASWQSWAIQVAVIFGVLLVIFIAIVMHSSEHITEPLRKLTTAAEQVNEGNYDFKLDYKGDDEVGILTSTFNNLVAHLKVYINDLNDLAYADALTSVHNKGAFDIYVKNLQATLDEADDATEFAVCVFDCNGLKGINDAFGHDKGDIYLKTACSVICETFNRSPVFRIGGDEFAAILSDADFMNRDALIELFDANCRKRREEAEARWEQVDVARGIAVFDPASDDTVGDTVRRADKLMYENKWTHNAGR